MKYCYIENNIIEEQIANYFKAVSNYFNENYNDNITIYLVGSLSRGEGSWILIQDRPYLISDIEYFIVSEKKINFKAEIEEILKKIELEIFGEERTTSFHIDYSYLTYSQIKKMERKLITYEAKELGKVICGVDIKSLFPKIDIQSINSFDIKDILNHRVFSMLYYYKWKKSSLDNREKNYLIAKNGLDLLTVYCIQENILEAGFKRRIEKLNLLNLGEKEKIFFKKCYNIKFNANFEINYCIEDFENQFLEVAEHLQKKFKIRKKSVLYNNINLIRRILGIIKRSIQVHGRILSPNRHFSHMIDAMKKDYDIKVRTQICKEHYVLYGYPIE